MLGKIKRTMQETKYAFTIRRALEQATMEELKITLKEVKRELEKRSKKTR